jgi:hypothetical protein
MHTVTATGEAPSATGYNGVQQLRSMGVRTPGYDSAASAGYGEHHRDFASGAAGNYSGIDPDVSAIPSATAVLGHMSQSDRQSRLESMRNPSGEINFEIAASHGAPHMARNVDMAAAQRNNMPWHTFDPRMSPNDRRRQDWEYQQQRRIQAEDNASGWRSGFGSARDDEPKRVSSHAAFLDNLWREQQGVGRAKRDQKTPEALRGLGLQTENPLDNSQHHGQADGSVALGLLAPPGAVELHHMLARRDAPPGHREPYAGGQRSPRQGQRAFEVSVGGGIPRFNRDGGNDVSMSPVPQRPGSPGRNQGPPADYSPVPRRGASYMYGVVDELNRSPGGRYGQ